MHLPKKKDQRSLEHASLFAWESSGGFEPRIFSDQPMSMHKGVFGTGSDGLTDWRAVEGIGGAEIRWVVQRWEGILEVLFFFLGFFFL